MERLLNEMNNLDKLKESANRTLMIFNKDKFSAWEERVSVSNQLAEMDLGVLGDSRLNMIQRRVLAAKKVFWTVGV